MRRSKLWIAAAVLVAALVTYLVWLKPPPSPEELVRRRIVQMERAAEDRDIAFVVAQISPRFQANGHIDRDEARRVLEQSFGGGTWRRLFLDSIETSASSSQTVSARVRVIFGRSDATRLRDLARSSVFAAYQIDAVAEREADGEWRFVSAQVTPLDPAQLL